LLGLLLVCGCNDGPSGSDGAGGRSDAADPGNAGSATALFAERTKDWQLDHIQNVGDLSDYEMPQIMSGGGALSDLDKDGYLDVLIVDLKTGSQQFVYRNNGQGQLVDVTAQSDIETPDEGMGAIVGDIDNDGFPDLYFTAVGADRLLMNNGDGTFRDVTVESSVDCQAWGSAACFNDLNRDGLLDLVVVNYLHYRPHEVCEDTTGIRDFCGPQAFPGAVDRLFINQGQFTETAGFQFEDQTVSSGLAGIAGKGLGIVCGDLTSDGLSDIYVTNDMEANHLWVQQADGTFRNEAELRGAALSWAGEPEASMGIVIADLTGKGRPELFMTHLRGQKNTLYVGQGAGSYFDETIQRGLSRPSLGFTGFGIAAEDFDHDGDIDLVVANGKVKREFGGKSADADLRADYTETNQAYLNDGQGFFAEHVSAAEQFTQNVEISRGLATGDIDRDGDIDFLLINCAGPARLYTSQASDSGNWLRLQLIDPVSNRDGVGAVVSVTQADSVMTRILSPSNGYLTTSDTQVHFGIPADTYDSIQVVWADGQTEEFPGGSANRALFLIRGTGRVSQQPEY
jgi:hypothetical protein